MVRQVNFDDRLHAVYERGRALPPDTVDRWMTAFARWAPVARPLSVLDLGSGVGRLSPALAEAFGGRVFGVEPSARMRAVAQDSARHPSVAYLGGRAEQLPLRDSSIDVVVLFLVLHHIADHAIAALEAARVLRPRGRVLIRSDFRGRVPNLLWHRYFPRARELEEQISPDLDEVTAAFGAAGLHRIALDRVRNRYAASPAAYAARLRMRALSTFEHLSEEEIVAGFSSLEADIATQNLRGPVEKDCDLLVLAGLDEFG